MSFSNDTKYGSTSNLLIVLNVATSRFVRVWVDLYIALSMSVSCSQVYSRLMAQQLSFRESSNQKTHRYVTKTIKQSQRIPFWFTLKIFNWHYHCKKSELKTFPQDAKHMSQKLSFNKQNFRRYDKGIDCNMCFFKPPAIPLSTILKENSPMQNTISKKIDEIKVCWDVWLLETLTTVTV